MEKILFTMFSSLFIIAACTSPMGSVGSTHEHATFKVFLDGKEFNFSERKYMVRDEYVHVEGGDGETIHKHATGVNLGFFFNTMGLKFDEQCFKTDSGDFCSNNEKKLKFYVNGVKNEEYGSHEIRDGEKYLITYGNENNAEIQEQLEAVKILK